MARNAASLAAALLLLTLAACAPKVGSPEWCAKMQERPKGDWTANEAGDFLKHCVVPGTEVGASEWCAKMQEKPKSDWTAKEAADFLKDCVVPGSKGKPN